MCIFYMMYRHQEICIILNALCMMVRNLKLHIFHNVYDRIVKAFC